MRTRDDKKQEALYLATIKLVNDIGFAASSISKIAKEANVSSATLYIYFKNKEDLLVSTYMEIKTSMVMETLDGLDEDLPLRDILHQIWRNTFHYVSKNQAEFRYTVQFSNSPFVDLVDKSKIEILYEPYIRAIQRGIDQKILKDVSLEAIGAFLFHPILALANPNHCKEFEVSEENIELTFQMAWDALRL